MPGKGGKLTDIFPPQEGPQSAYLFCDADITGYGGAAGGGKTFGTLLDASQFVDNPGYGAVIFRRTMKQVKDEGGPWDESANLYPLVGGKPNLSQAYWTFPSGATISFAGLEHEHDKYAWQSAQICRLYFEEGTHFTEGQFWYMLSRNRSTCGVRPQVRITMNPYPGFLKRLFAPWVDKKFNNPAQPGEIRWFKRENNQIVWVDDPPARQPCECLKPNCLNCFPEEKSITFIPASVYDNKELLRKNPDYLINLKVQDEVEKRRLLYGDWDAKPAHLVLDAFVEARNVIPYREIPKAWPSYAGADFGSVNQAEVAVVEELAWDADKKRWGDPTGKLIVIGAHWPGVTRSFEQIGNDIRDICGGMPKSGAGGNRTGEQGWRQAIRKEGIPMEEPNAKHADPVLQYQCVNDEFRSGNLLIMESNTGDKAAGLAQLIEMINNFQRILGDDGKPTDKFDDTKFHLLAALRYITVKLRPPLPPELTWDVL